MLYDKRSSSQVEDTTATQKAVITNDSSNGIVKSVQRKIRKFVFTLAFMGLALILFSNSVVVTYMNEYQVVRQLGQIVNVHAEPGFSFKVPFIQSASSVPKSIQLYDIPVSEVITKDKKSMVVDCIILWRVTDAEKFIRNLGGSLANAEVRISNITYNSMKNIISGMDQQDMLSGRDQLAKLIQEGVGNSLDSYGVELVAFETKRNDLPDANKAAVYERMISERNNIAAQYRAEGAESATMIKNTTDKEVSIIISNARASAAEAQAAGESEYMKILAEAYGSAEKAEFYSFMRSLDAAKKSLGNGTTLMLDKNSPIAKIFYELN